MRLTGLFKFLAIILISNTLHAQYQVEVLVFKTLDNRSFATEFWHDDWQTPPVDQAVLLTTPDLSSAITFPEPVPAWRFVLSPSRRLNNFRTVTPSVLQGSKDNMDRSANYRVLLHTAWQQPRLSRNQAIAVRLQGGQPYQVSVFDRSSSTKLSTTLNNPFEQSTPVDAPTRQARLWELDGTITIGIDRFIHLQTDLLLTRPVQMTEQGLIPAKNSGELYGFNLQASARMRSRETHFIDHPLFGLLVHVKSVQ